MTRTLLALCCVTLPFGAYAQEVESPLGPRADVGVTAGWLHADVRDLFPEAQGFHGRDWTHDQGTIGAFAGWYWTEHLKTEAGLERTSAANHWDYQSVVWGRDVVYLNVDHKVRETRLVIGQYFQFGHNQWIHPSVGAGVTLRRREHVTGRSAGVLYGRTPSSAPLVVVPAERVERTTTDASAFVSVAVKFYMSRRAFFRLDTQVDVRNGLEQVTTRAGLGLDF